MKKFLTISLMATLGVLFLAMPSFAATEHCPNHQGHPGKVEGNSNDLVLDAGVEFCVKAGPKATGKLTADGVRTLKEHVEASGIRVGKDNVPDVSYYVTYEVPAPEPTPDPTPEPTPDPTPDPTPEPTPDPTPEPDPTPTPEPTPDPTPEPTPTPDPTEEPEPKVTIPEEDPPSEAPDPPVIIDETSSQELPDTGVSMQLALALATAGLLSIAIGTFVVSRLRRATSKR